MAVSNNKIIIILLLPDLVFGAFILVFICLSIVLATFLRHSMSHCEKVFSEKKKSFTTSGRRQLISELSEVN